jgi:hypothetical protein
MGADQDRVTELAEYSQGVLDEPYPSDFNQGLILPHPGTLPACQHNTGYLHDNILI